MRWGLDPWVRKIPWWRKWQSTPALMPGKSHGWRSLIGYSPWDPQRVGHDWETWRTYLKPPNCLLCYFENSESSRPHYKGSLYYTPFPTQGSNPSLMSPALAGGFFTNSATWEARVIYQVLPNCLLKTSGNCPVFPNSGNVHTSKQNMLSQMIRICPSSEWMPF